MKPSAPNTWTAASGYDGQSPARSARSMPGGRRYGRRRPCGSETPGAARRSEHRAAPGFAVLSANITSSSPGSTRISIDDDDAGPARLHPRSIERDARERQPGLECRSPADTAWCCVRVRRRLRRRDSFPRGLAESASPIRYPLKYVHTGASPSTKDAIYAAFAGGEETARAEIHVRDRPVDRRNASCTSWASPEWQRPDQAYCCITRRAHACTAVRLIEHGMARDLRDEQAAGQRVHRVGCEDKVAATAPVDLHGQDPATNRRGHRRRSRRRRPGPCPRLVHG